MAAKQERIYFSEANTKKTADYVLATSKVLKIHPGLYKEKSGMKGSGQ